MTASQAKELAQSDENIIQIEHNPYSQYTVLTGIVDGHAFYDALSMRSFQALQNRKIISQSTFPEYGSEIWRFTQK
jgi:hypothetical protein